MAALSPQKGHRRRKSMDPVSEVIRFNELPRPNGRFVIQELVGIGTTAKVYSALDKQNGNVVAIKIISDLAENIMEIESEYTSLSSIGGQGFCPKFYGTFYNERQGGCKELWFVMEFCQGVTVLALLRWLEKENKRLREEEISVLLKTFLMALHQLHCNDIVHRDIRGSNLIISPEGEVKLIDYGSSCVLKEGKVDNHSIIGAPHWMAPEIIASEQWKPSKSCDIWSLGITAIELAQLHPPLYDVHPTRALFQIARYPPQNLQKTSEWSEAYKDFIDECLVKTPDHRPHAAELLFHPFIMETADVAQKITVEEFLEQKKTPDFSDQEKKILKTLGELARECCDGGERICDPYVTFKNWHFKSAPDSPYTRVLIDDAASMEQITERNLLDLLRQRYLQKSTFTFIGDVLVSVHPRQKLQQFQSEIQRNYCERAKSDNEPHPYAVADRAYQQLLHHRKSQTVILFGESGSGKSTLAKEIINQLAFLGQVNTDKRSFGMAEKIRLICPLLDAFGNMQIDGNPDASRYLKTISVSFTKTGKICGAILNAHMLDDWKITTCMSKVNYHVIYYVYEGLKAERRFSEFGLDKLGDNRFLPDVQSRDVMTSLKGYNLVLSALRCHAFVEEEITSILRTVASVILLGDVKYTMKGNVVHLENPNTVDAVADTLRVNKRKLSTFLVRTKDADDARKRSDALAALLYVALSDWIVSSLNRKLSFSRLVLGERYSVWLIDAPGCSKSASNSLFELRANIINDFLQIRIEKLLFVKELEELNEENVTVPFKHEDFAVRAQELEDRDTNYKKLIDGMQKLVAEGRQWTNHLDSVVRSVYTGVEKNAIVIQHIFEQVRYEKATILPQNKTADDDGDFIAITKTSSDSVISRFWNELPNQHLWQFMDTLTELNNVHESEFPHLVICMNPNSADSLISEFEEKHVLKQIRTHNLNEMAMIRKHGYARRLLFADFLNRYKFLAFDFNETVDMTADNCRLLLIRLKMDGWLIGTNKVFLKYYAEEYLSRLYERHVKKIIKVQAMARRFIVKATKRI